MGTNKKNIVIYGGEFNNKGAQAMSFITISRLKNEFPEHEILFASENEIKRDETVLSKYNFKIIQSPFIRKNFIGENIVRKILKKEKRINSKESIKLLENTEYLFDISGYALSSQWGIAGSKKYLDRFNLARKMGIKTVILPQSIGPFNYGDQSLEMEKYIKNSLQYVNVIMPREKQGVRDLRKLNLSDNVYYSPDIVLTNKKEISWDSIYKKKIEVKSYEICPNSVVVIPNMRNFDHGNKEKIMNIYKNIIVKLIENKKNIYLVRHSFEDIKACTLIKEMFPNDDRIRLIGDDMTPIEFELLIKQFDMCIASRFHSVVHAYKMGTPCVILGWATKYKELAKLFRQEGYVFDVREQFDDKRFAKEFSYMIENYKKEKEVIIDQLKLLTEYSDPFDIAFKNVKF